MKSIDVYATHTQRPYTRHLVILFLMGSLYARLWVSSLCHPIIILTISTLVGHLSCVTDLLSRVDLLLFQHLNCWGGRFPTKHSRLIKLVSSPILLLHVPLDQLLVSGPIPVGNGVQVGERTFPAIFLG